MSRHPSYQSRLLKIFTNISLAAQDVNKVELEKFQTAHFYATVLAAFVKCIEFNHTINRRQAIGQSFYYTAFLRGICEDQISLKFLLKLAPPEREKITVAYIRYMLSSSMEAQQEYFKKTRRFQPVPIIENAADAVSSDMQTLHTIWEQMGHRKGKTFPSVEQMAIDSGLKDLYTYLYHATSRAVHFSPNVLLRTGWYKSADHPIRFSASNFSNYYSLFNSHYGGVLMIEFFNAFGKYLGVSQTLKKEIQEIKKAQEGLSFFPEIITYEELNLKRPGNIDYKVIQMAAGMQKEERKAFLQQLPELIAEVKKKAEKRKTKR